MNEVTITAPFSAVPLLRTESVAFVKGAPVFPLLFDVNLCITLLAKLPRTLNIILALRNGRFFHIPRVFPANHTRLTIVLRLFFLHPACTNLSVFFGALPFLGSSHVMPSCSSRAIWFPFTPEVFSLHLSRLCFVTHRPSHNPVSV